MRRFRKNFRISEELVIPDKSLSLYEGAVAPWRGETMSNWQKPWLKKAIHYDFPVHQTIQRTDQRTTRIALEGHKELDGIDGFFKYLESSFIKFSIAWCCRATGYRTNCPDCRGTRLRKDAAYVKIADTSITDISLMPIEDAFAFFQNLKLNDFDKSFWSFAYWNPHAIGIHGESWSRLSHLESF